MDDHRLTTNNRFAQVGWLRDVAKLAVSATFEGATAEELVEFMLDEANWQDPNDAIQLPSWFDEHDRRLLTNMVRRRIA